VGEGASAALALDAAALLESCEDLFDFREDPSESSDDLEKSSQDLEKSLHVLEEAVAVLLIFLQDRFGFAAVIERFRAVRFGFVADRLVAREDLSQSIA
jgi:hypothetical protein